MQTPSETLALNQGTPCQPGNVESWFYAVFATSWLCGLGPVTFLWASVSLPVHRGD